MALSGVIYLQIAALAQATSTQQTTDADAKVAAIIDDVLKRGEGMSGNVKTKTWVPPSPEDIARIREIGHDAIAPLNKALDSPTRSFEQTLAVTLLGALGGPDIVPSLKRALEADNFGHNWLLPSQSGLRRKFPNRRRPVRVISQPDSLSVTSER